MQRLLLLLLLLHFPLPPQPSPHHQTRMKMTTSAIYIHLPKDKEEIKGSAEQAAAPCRMLQEPFSFSTSLQGVSPEKVVVKVKDRQVSVCGEHIERKEADGIIKYTFHGFSTIFDLPLEVDPNSLTVTVSDGATLKIVSQQVTSYDTNSNGNDADAMTSCSATLSLDTSTSLLAVPRNQ
uniref:SHSP domain-containing protein n=1 Tax=Callorhinchus milii TaxID=7868 RepID=A0A4W3JMT9_CALMI